MGLSTQEWQQKGNYFVHLGRRIFYMDEGQGPTLICLHGFPTASWDWEPIWQELTSHFRVVALDFLGFGFSDKPRSHTYSLLEQADIVESLAKHLSISVCHVLSHDYGDSVAQELMARHQDKGEHAVLQLLSVCMLNGGIIPATHRPQPIQTLLIGPFGPLLVRLLSKKRMMKALAKVFGPETQPSQTVQDEFWHLISQQNGHLLSHRILVYLHDRRDNAERWVGALQKNQLPYCFINGPEDPISGRHMAEKLKELAPQSQVVYLDNIGHYPQTEDPQGTWQAYWSFVSPLLSPA